MLMPNRFLMAAYDDMTHGQSLRMGELFHQEFGYWGAKFNSTMLSWPIPKVKQHSRYGGIFGDLKLHDKPDTVANAVKKYRDAVDYLSVHTLGGVKMCKAAVETAAGHKAEIVGISLLTSLSKDELNRNGILPGPMSVEECVLYYIRLGLEAGIKNFVCSGLEARAAKKLVGDGKIIVAGIRLPDDPKGDQERTCTPEEAVKAGADLYVGGTAVVKKPDPLAAHRDCVSRIKQTKAHLAAAA